MSNSPTITFRLPEPLRARVTAESERRGISVTELIREAVERALAHPHPAQDD